MSEINPINPPSSLHRTSVQPAHSHATANGNGIHRPGDSVEVSQTAELLARLADLPDVRTDLVNQVRKEIETGQYDADGKKLDLALDSDELLHDLRGF